MMGNDTKEPSLSDELLEQEGAAGSGGTSRSVQPCDMSVEMILALGQGGADDVFAPVDPEALLAGIRGKLDAEKFAALIDSCQRECLEAVIRPFGIGRVLFENSDRSGGPVATPHNMRKQYSKNNLRGSKFKEILVPKEHLYGNNVGKYRTKRCASAMGRYRDARSGMGLANIDEATGKATENPEVNHLNPLRKFHVEGSGFMLSDAGKEAFACDERNFILIDRGANRSQREQGYDEWKNKPASDGDGRTNGRKFEHDGRRTKHKKAKADQAFNERAATPLQKMSYYAVNISKTGLAEGRRMALQQALGVVMEEFVRACFAEVKDAWHNGFAAKVDESFLDALSVRLKRVAKKVLARWKDAAFALRDGFLSGFLSNLIVRRQNKWDTFCVFVTEVLAHH